MKESNIITKNIDWSSIVNNFNTTFDKIENQCILESLTKKDKE
jgi:hypothetical protein